MKRTIFHIDQNCFFASVEMIAHPEYRKVPMAVTGDASKRHGIILARNELAKQAGVKTAEAIWQAEQKCPGLVKVSSHYEKYAFYSGRLRAMFEEYSDRVEPFGMDECWVDMTDAVGNRDPRELADDIRRRVREEFKLSCSVGVSFNKIFAKLGSDYKKPDATTVITEENFRDIVWPLPAADLLFVGGATANRLNEVNIRTIGDIARSPREFMAEYLGKPGDSLWLYANGIDDSPVAPANEERQYKSIGNSMTTPKDIMNRSQACGTFHTLAASVASRLRKHKLLGCNVAITVRDKDLITYEHQRTLFEPTNSEKVIYETAMELFDESYDWHTAIRSVGVRCAKVIPEDSGVQLSMFSESQEKREEDSKLNKVIDDINRRFGDGTIKSCASMQGIMSPNYDPEFYDGGITEGKKDPFK